MLDRFEDKLAKAIENGIYRALYQILNERIPKNLLDLLSHKPSQIEVPPQQEPGPLFDMLDSLGTNIINLFTFKKTK